MYCWFKNFFLNWIKSWIPPASTFWCKAASFFFRPPHNSFLLLCFCFLANNLFAQQNEKYLYQDSSIIYQHNKANNSGSKTEQAADNEEENEFVPEADTILVNNNLFITPDSNRALKKEKSFAYAKILDSLLKDLQKQQEKNYTVNSGRSSAADRFFSALPTKLFFWGVAIIMLGFIVVKLFFTEGLFQRKSAGSKVKLLDATEDAIPDAKDYNRLIQQAINKNDFRLATRYLYLQSLYRLIEQGAVLFAVDKTNHQYLTELAGKPYQQAFAAVTLQYEYAWYGGFAIEEFRFKDIQQTFNQFNNELQRAV